MHRNDEAPAFARASKLDRGRNLGLLHVHCVEAFWALLNIESDFVTFEDRATGAGLVNEDVFAAFVRGDETKTFLRVEELNCTC